MDSFKYLGNYVTKDMLCTKEINIRIATGKELFNSYFVNYWTSMYIRRRPANCYAWSMVTHGYETWTLRKEDELLICGFGENWQEWGGWKRWKMRRNCNVRNVQQKENELTWTLYEKNIILDLTLYYIDLDIILYGLDIILYRLDIILYWRGHYIILS